MALNKVPQYFRKAFQDFSGGLNDYDSPLLVKQNQFTELENAVVNDRGLLEKAKGYAVDGSPFPDDVDSFIRLIVNYRSGTTVDKLIVAAVDEGNTNATYKVDLKETEGDGNYAYIGHTTGTASFTNGSTSVTGSGTSWSTQLKAGDKIKATAHADGVYAEISSVTNNTALVLTANYSGATVAGVAYIARKILDTQRLPQAINFNDKLVITNGLDAVLTYNDTTVDCITDAQAPKGRYIEAHKNRVFMASVTASPSSIYWSAVNDETSWDAAGFEPVFPQDGGQIVGIKSFSDSLIVLKDNGKMYQVVGSFDQDNVGEPDFIRKIDTPENMGIIAGFTAVVGNDNKLYFLTETGVYTLDSRLFIEKISWPVDNAVADMRIQVGAERTRTFTYDSAAQWNGGTHNGTHARDGILRPYFDRTLITDATKRNGCVSVAIDSNKDVHVAYLSSDLTTIKYQKWLASDNSLDTAETVMTITNSTMSLSLDLDGTTPGVAVKEHNTSGGKTYYSKRTGGSWAAKELVFTSGTTSAGVSDALNIAGISLRFRSDGLPRIAVTGTSIDNAGVTYLMRDGSAVGTVGAWTSISYRSGVNNFIRCALDLFANNDPRIVATVWDGSGSNGGDVVLLSGGGGEASLSLVETVTDAGLGSYWNVSLQKNSANTYFSLYLKDSIPNLKQWGGAVTEPIFPASTNSVQICGHFINSSNEQNYYVRSSRSSASYYEEQFVFANTEDVYSGGANNTIDDYFSGDRGLHANGNVFASAAFGVNANEIILRRLAYKGIYTSAERNDANLGSWGAYDVGGQVSAGNTVLHEVALSATSPTSSYSTITDGTVISSDPTMLYIKFRVTFTLAALAQSEIDSIILNYAEDAIGWFVPGGVLYDNQYYISYAEPADTANSRVLVLDRDKAWTTIQYPVTFMTRFRGQLYAGSATTGKVYKLLQDYNFNASAYTMTATSKEDLLGSIELEKEIYKIYVLYEVKASGTIDFAYRTDNFKTSGGSSWVTTEINQTQDGIAEVPYIGSPFRSIQFRIQNDELDAQVGVIGFVVVYGLLGIR